jgi:hypothetical protein
MKKIKINLNEKKTEAGWQEAIDSFWMNVTPKWFELLEWVIIIGAFTFLANLTKNMILNIVSGISYISVFFYLQSVFFSLEIFGFPKISSERSRKIVSLTISAILSLGLWLILNKLVSEIQGKL